MSNPVERISWPLMTAGAIVTMAFSLSVHAVMLQGFHVPYPYNFPHTGLARLPDEVLSVLGAMYLSAHLPENIRRRSFVFRCAFMFLFLATIHEDFFRGPFMEFINLSNFMLYPFVDNLPKLIPFAIIAVGVEYWTDRKTGIEATLIAAIPLAAVASLVIAPLSNHVFTGVLHFTEAREGHQRYGVPYDWHILLPAYLTFFEPVIAAFVIGYAVRRQLPSTPLLQFGITAALVVALKGPVFAALLNIQYAGTTPSTAILSYAQFTFETVALGILTAATLQMSLKEISTKDFRLSDHDEAAST